MKFRFLPVLVLLATLLHPAFAAEPGVRGSPVFPRERTKTGAWLLNAFSPVSQNARHSVVLLESQDHKAALGTVVDADGLVLTKASEVAVGELTARLYDGERVPAEIVSVDEASDVALIRVASKRLKPIEWARLEPSVGQWAITPGIDSHPEAVGIVSSPPRKILPKRALIGVQLDFDAAEARIAEVMPGMGAEKAGLRAGDVILAVNGEAVSSSEVLRRTLGQFREGQTVKLQVRRDSDPFDVSLSMMAERLGRGFNRQDRMNRLGGEISRRAEGFELAIQHDTVLQPWQCGGPLLDLDGKAIGLNIARAGRIASYALPAKMVMHLAESLKRQTQTPVKERPSS